jgi:hypothetical protein
MSQNFNRSGCYYAQRPSGDLLQPARWVMAGSVTRRLAHVDRQPPRADLPCALLPSLKAASGTHQPCAHVSPTRYVEAYDDLAAGRPRSRRAAQSTVNPWWSR